MAGALSAAADPWAGIRQLKFSQYDYEHPAVAYDAEAGGYAQDAYTEKLWGVDQDALNAGGFNTKYAGVPEEVEPGLFKITVQQPGAHKYDTADAYYRVDPETGIGTLVDDPTSTRQTSSKDKWQDRLEKRILPIAGAVLGAGYGLGAMGYGSGIPGLSGAAGAAAPGAGGVNLGMGGATAGDFGMMIGADGAATYGGIGAAEAAGAAAAAGGAGAGGGALSGLDAAMADVAKSGAITPDKMGGTGMNWLDTALSAGKSVFGNDWLTTAMSLVGSGVQQYSIEKAAQEQRDWLDSKDIDRRRRQAPGALPAMKTTVYTKGGG